MVFGDLILDHTIFGETNKLANEAPLLAVTKAPLANDAAELALSKAPLANDEPLLAAS